ncbi:MAG: hypothetical protein LUE29_09485 [Lachnospiraceae bacterium]|nr:hypothetical protein [Lachnospiraceae bacterium]
MAKLTGMRGDPFDHPWRKRTEKMEEAHRLVSGTDEKEEVRKKARKDFIRKLNYHSDWD